MAYFSQFDNTLYTSMDTSCESWEAVYYSYDYSGSQGVEPCLSKGDLIFITDANWGSATADIGDKTFVGGGGAGSYGAGFSDTTDLYTITKIWTAEESEDTIQEV